MSVSSSISPPSDMLEKGSLVDLVDLEGQPLETLLTHFTD